MFYSLHGIREKNCVKSLYLIVNEMIGYIKESNEIKDLVLVPTDSRQNTLKKSEIK